MIYKHYFLIFFLSLIVCMSTTCSFNDLLNNNNLLHIITIANEDNSTNFNILENKCLCFAANMIYFASIKRIN